MVLVLPKNMIVYHLPYEQLGFTKQEWESIPSRSRAIIRDFYINGRNITATQKYEYHMTDFSVRRIVQRYGLRQRPTLLVKAEDFYF